MVQKLIINFSLTISKIRLVSNIDLFHDFESKNKFSFKYQLVLLTKNMYIFMIIIYLWKISQKQQKPHFHTKLYLKHLIYSGGHTTL